MIIGTCLQQISILLTAVIPDSRQNCKKSFAVTRATKQSDSDVEDRVDGANLAFLHRWWKASAAVPQLVPDMEERTGEHNDPKTDATPNGRWKRCRCAEAVRHDEAR